MFHALAFWIGRQLAANTVAKGPSGVPLARAISLQTGMQSSLLALLLATRYFSDPLVRQVAFPVHPTRMSTSVSACTEVHQSHRDLL